MLLKREQLKKLLREADLVSEDDLKQAETRAKREGVELDEALVEGGFINDEHLGRVIAEELEMNFINLRNEKIDKKILNIVPEVVAEKQHVMAFRQDNDNLLLAMADPNDLNIIKILEKKTGLKVIPYLATQNDLEGAMRYYHEDIEKAFNQIIEENLKKLQQTGKKDISAEQAALELPIVKIVDTILEYGYENHASDIHIEPFEDHELIRFRIDGVLHDVLELPKNIHDLIVTRLKIMSKLRTDEHRAAQDGRIEVRFKKEKLDIRISVVPITEGEKVVMRLLSERTRRFSLEDLGLSAKDYKKVKAAANKPYGMILATGPTGSGKTTTLYSILKQLNRREVNIATIEDPVEYDMESVNQIQVNPRTNLTFAKGLRSIIRQDPDIIMVGEIRDIETAGIAVNAAMTGHLVLSTLHTNDAPTTLPRLLDMEIEPFLVASTVNVAIGQRLVRKICTRCIESYTLKGQKLETLKKEIDFERLLGKNKISQLRLYRGKGCKYCNDSGYTGRIGIFEVMDITEKIKEMIMQRKNSEEIKKQAISEGMTTMIGDGLQKALSGVTTIEEVLRVSRM